MVICLFFSIIQTVFIIHSLLPYLNFLYISCRLLFLCLFLCPSISQLLFLPKKESGDTSVTCFKPMFLSFPCTTTRTLLDYSVVFSLVWCVQPSLLLHLQCINYYLQRKDHTWHSVKSPTVFCIQICGSRNLESIRITGRTW
jgi:hypothetical protein